MPTYGSRVTKEQLKQRTYAFNRVRNKPYYIAVNKGETDLNCYVKSRLLQKALKRHGLDSRHRACEFKWEDFIVDDVAIPKEILELEHDPSDFHVFTDVYIPEKGKRVRVDCAWDPGLKKSPLFPVNEWDGQSNVEHIAVPYSRILTPEDSRELLTEDDELYSDTEEDYMEADREFCIALNRYMQAIRDGNVDKFLSSFKSFLDTIKRKR